MSSLSDSDREGDEWYEIVDVPDDAMYSDSEDVWADDEGDTVIDINGGPTDEPAQQSGKLLAAGCIHSHGRTDQGSATNYKMLKSTDIIGKQFVSEEDAKSFFSEYARVIGFGLRRHNKRWNTKGKLVGRIWVCSRQGYRHAKYLDRDNRMREARPITMSGCEVEFRIAAKDGQNGWVCTHFNGKHDHDLTPSHHVHYIRYHRRLTDADFAAAVSLNKVGVTPSQIHEYMVERSGGYREVGYLRRDVQNRLDYAKRKKLTETDAETCLSYLEGKKSADPAFYYQFIVNEDNKLGDLFWCDGGARADYAVFGDVLAFDATYRTNSYRKPFVVLLGINHHRRTIVFGFALLSDETEQTYTWLLETFLAAMDRKQPKTVITNGDKAMRKAILTTFPEAKHRLCCWHLGQNAQSNVNKEFTLDFRRCMLRPYSQEHFEEKWKEIVLHHNVESHEWVVKMYNEKTMWVEAYLRGHFFGGMRSTQRSKGMNAYLNHYVSIRMRLIAFVKQMDRLMDRQREVEGKDDFDSAEGQPVLITHMKPYEGAAAEVYTRAMFRLVREQILQEGMLIAVQVINDELSRVFRVKKWKVSDKEWRVQVHGTWTTVSCTCLMMEMIGVPCSHLFAVMKVDNLEAIPSCLILSRWSKHAKLGISNKLQCTWTHQYMSEAARLGSLHAACRNLQKVAAKSTQAFDLAITQIHKLSMQLEPMSGESAKEQSKSEFGKRFKVEDPMFVITKGCRKKPKMGPPQQRKCSRCGNEGHTVRKCKTKLQNSGEDIEIATQTSMFMGENTVLHPCKRSGIRTRGTAPNNSVHNQQQMAQQPNINSHASSSDSWYQQFGISTDNDSTDDTMMHSLIPEYKEPNGSMSTFASDYGNIWLGNRI